MKKIKGVYITAIFILYFFINETVSRETGPIIINEIYPFSGNKDEWIELKNRSDISINLKNWQLSDITKTSIITFNDYWLNSGEVVLIVKSENSFKNSSVKYIKMHSWIVLNNDEEIITLSLPNSILMSDSISYNESLFKNMDYSLSRLKEDEYAIDELNWYSSLPTPGYIIKGDKQNSEKVKYDLLCKPLIVTPNNDGIDDYLSIQVLGKQGEINRLEIFDFSGRLCFSKNVFSNEVFNWDGKIEAKKRLVYEPVFIVVKFPNEKSVRRKAIIWN